MQTKNWEKEGFLLQVAKKTYVLGLGPFSIKSNPSPYKWSLFYSPFFFSHSRAYWHIPQVAFTLSDTELKQFLNYLITKKLATISANSFLWKEPNFKAFQSVFQTIQKHIQKNKIQKAVPVFFESTPFIMNKNKLLYFLNKLLTCQEGFAYAFWSKAQTIIGITPEVLFHKKGLLVETMSLAGTAQSASSNLLNNKKERQEHQLVIQGIYSALKVFGKLCASNTYVKKTNHVQHLQTNIKLLLKKNISFDILCKALHPTPALGTYPTKEALKYLKQLQTISGKRYGFGSPFGVHFGNIAFCVVAIRNIQLIHNKMLIGSGCGIVKNSQIDQEWEELKLKRESVKKILL